VEGRYVEASTSAYLPPAQAPRYARGDKLAMKVLVANIEDVMREAAARWTLIAYFLLSTIFIIIFASAINLDIVNGALACYVTRGEKELRVFLPDDEPSRSIVAKEVARALASLVETGLRRALLFTEVDDEIAPFLVEAGFRRTSTGYQMRHA